MELYIDVIFLINLIMVYFILWIVSRLIRRNISKKRILASSGIGALIYCFLMLFVVYDRGINFITAMADILLTVYICFKPKDIKNYLKLFVLTNISAFILGGGGMAVFYYTNIGYYVGNMLTFGLKNISVKLLIGFFFIFYFVLNFIFIRYKEMLEQKQSFADIRLKINHKQIEIRALIDTGNSMKEPCENRPVIIAEFESIKNALPEKLRLLYYEDKQNNLSELIKIIDDLKYEMKFTLIPFSSLGKANGVILALRAEKADIIAEKRIEINMPFVAICKDSLSVNNRFNSIISPELLAGQEV